MKGRTKTVEVADVKLHKIVLSRGRAESISTHTLLKDGDFDLVVPESQLEAYQSRVKNARNILTVPDDLKGLGKVRNRILDMYNNEDMVMLDDDLKHFTSLMGLSPKNYHDPVIVDQIIMNCYRNALEAGCTLFSFNQKCDVRKYRQSQPFSFTVWSGTIMGLCGEKKRFTEVNDLKVDADYSLKCLLEDRRVWVDQRFGFLCIRDTNTGGNAEFRSPEKINEEIAFLKDKWGKHIKITQSGAKHSLRLVVERKQKIQV